jgi:hypothetical protein
MSKTTKGRRRITFMFEKASTGQVILTGDFNQWDIEKHPMRKRPDGIRKKVSCCHRAALNTNSRWTVNGNVIQKTITIVKLHSGHKTMLS